MHLVDNARIPFSEIAKKLEVAPGTVHSRVRRMEESGVISGTTVRLNYNKLGLTFIAYVGVFLSQTSDSQEVMTELIQIPEVTVAHLVTGQYGIYAKLRARDTAHAKRIIYDINRIPGITRTESTISLEECINDSQRLIRALMSEDQPLKP